MATGQLVTALRGPSSCFVKGQHFDLLESTWPDWLWVEAALRGTPRAANLVWTLNLTFLFLPGVISPK